MPTLPDIGEMRHRVIFQTATRNDDGYGGGEMVWHDAFEAWVSIEPISGREYFDAMQMQNEITHRIKTRYRSDISPEMRIIYGSKIFSIEAVIDMKNAHRFLEILCRE
jgi:SPP1 family predicted phage head-tail adaptor